MVRGKCLFQSLTYNSDPKNNRRQIRQYRYAASIIMGIMEYLVVEFRIEV